MIITVRAKYWGAFMRTTLRSDLQQQFTAGCGQTKRPSRLEFALEIVLLLRINKVVLKIVLKMLPGCQGRMSGQAICPGQQQQGLESSSPCICKLKLEAGSMYFILILLSSPDGWADGTQAALWRHRVRDWRPLGTGQMDGRWIQENDGHCVRNCKQDGTTSISGSSLRVTDKSTLQGELEGGRNWL